MADYQLSYTGAEINNRLNMVPSLDNRLRSLEKWKHVDITGADCVNTYVRNARGFYECWGNFCFIYVTIQIGATALPANTMVALTLDNIFPPPEYNSMDGRTGTYQEAGFASLTCNRNCYPYVRNTGGIYISAQSTFTGTNSNIFISGMYPIAEEYLN